MKRCTCETSNDTREGWVRHKDGGVWCNECLAPVVPRLTLPEAHADIIRLAITCKHLEYVEVEGERLCCRCGRPEIPPPRLTEAEARAIVAVDDRYGPSDTVAAGWLDGWLALVAEARARLSQGR